MLILVVYPSPLARSEFGVEDEVPLVLHDIDESPSDEGAVLVAASEALARVFGTEPAAVRPWIHGPSPLRSGSALWLRSPEKERSFDFSFPQQRTTGARLVSESGPDCGHTILCSRGATELGRTVPGLRDTSVPRKLGRIEVSAAGTKLFSLSDPTASALRVFRGAELLPPSRHQRLWGRSRSFWDLEHGDLICAGSVGLRFLVRPDLPSTPPVPAAPEQRRHMGNPGMLTTRLMMAGMPLLISIIMAVSMRQPAFLLFGLLSLAALFTPLVERAHERRTSHKRLREEARHSLKITQGLFPPQTFLRAEEAECQRLPDPDELKYCLPGLQDMTGSVLSPPPWFPIRLGSSVSSDRPDHGRRRVRKTLSVPTAAHQMGLILTKRNSPMRFRISTPDPRGLVRAVIVNTSGHAGETTEQERPEYVVSAHAELCEPQSSSFAHFAPLPHPSSFSQRSSNLISSGRAHLHLCRSSDASRCAAAKQADTVLEIVPGQALQPWIFSAIEQEHPNSGSPEPAYWVPDHISAAAFRRRAAEQPAAAHRKRLCPLPVLPETGSPEGGMLSLLSHGPHALVVGTTGSGKTELLKKLIADFCLSPGHTPVRFYLIDFKGGAGFQQFSRLPQVHGVSTNIDGSEVLRVLTSLTAELERRQRWMAHRSLTSFEDLQWSVEAPCRLIIMIDEFKALLDACPEASDLLAKVAALGRSLGVHLILSTQKLGGAIPQSLRANIPLTLALRVATDVDSFELLGNADASALPQEAPGTVIAKSSNGQLSPVRAAPWDTPFIRSSRCTLWPEVSPDEERPAGNSEAAMAGLAEADVSNRAAPAEALGCSEKESLSRMGEASWPGPVAAPIPRLCPGDPLPPAMVRGGRYEGPPIALADEPARQRTFPIAPGPNPMLLLGAPRSGVGEALKTWAESALERTPEVPSVLICSASSPLWQLRSRFSFFCSHENSLDLLELIRALPVGRAPGIAVMDGLDQILDQIRSLGPRAEEEELAQWVAVASQHSWQIGANTLKDPHKLSALFPAKAYFPLHAPQHITIGWPSAAHVAALPGRALCTGSWMGLSDESLVSAQFALGMQERAGRAAEDLPHTASPEFRPLDESLCRRAEPAVSGVFQLGASTRMEPVCLSHTPALPITIIGGAGSGKSTLLRNLSAQASDAGDSVFWIDSNSSPTQLLDVSEAIADQLVEENRCGPVVLFIDDIDRLPEEHLHRLTGLAGKIRIAVSCGPRSGFSLGRLLPAARGSMHGALLSPLTPQDGEMLGIRAMAFPRLLPGLGWACEQGVQTRFRSEPHPCESKISRRSKEMFP